MKDPGYIFSTELSVRDYECDIQGVVNNANYLHYLEHARHQYLLSRQIDFIELHKTGIDLVVTKIEIEYKYPLRSQDRFVIRLRLERDGNVRLVFVQDIFRVEDEKLIARARVTGVSTKNGRPLPPREIISKLQLD